MSDREREMDGSPAPSSEGEGDRLDEAHDSSEESATDEEEARRIAEGSLSA